MQLKGDFSGTVVICFCLQLSYFYFSNVFLTELIVVIPEWISIFFFFEFVEFRIWNFKIFTWMAVCKIMHISEFFLAWGWRAWVWKLSKLYLGDTGDVAKHLEESWCSFILRRVTKKQLCLQYLFFRLAVWSSVAPLYLVASFSHLRRDHGNV